MKRAVSSTSLPQCRELAKGKSLSGRSHACLVLGRGLTATVSGKRTKSLDQMTTGNQRDGES